MPPELGDYICSSYVQVGLGLQYGPVYKCSCMLTMVFTIHSYTCCYTSPAAEMRPAVAWQAARALLLVLLLVLLLPLLLLLLLRSDLMALLWPSLVSPLYIMNNVTSKTSHV